MRFEKLGLALVLAVLAAPGLDGAGLASGSRVLAAEGGESQTLTGQVIRSNPDSRAIQVQTGLFSTSRFTVADDAVLSNSSGGIRLEDLEEGDTVTVEYVERDGVKSAGSVVVNDVEASLPAGAETHTQTETSAETAI